jgi:transcriptional regulator with XRE-family HTH domain
MAQQPRELTPNSSSHHLFGAELRRARLRANLSLADLCRKYEDYGRRLNVGYLANVEKGERFPDDVQVAKIADSILGAEGLLERLWDFARTQKECEAKATRSERLTAAKLSAQAVIPLSRGESVLVPIVAGGTSIQYARMSRRAFIETGLGAVVSVGATTPDETERLLRALEQPHRVDSAVVEYFIQLLAIHRTTDYVLHPADRVSSITSYLATIERLRKQAREPIRNRLLQLQAEYAEYIGWLHEELANLVTAEHWTSRSSDWAKAAGDGQMLSFAYLRKSTIALYDARYLDASELASAAIDEPNDCPPGLASLAAQYRARAHATLASWDLQNEAECLKALDRAAELLSQRENATTDRIYWPRSHDYADLEVTRAFCYRDLGASKLGAAIDILTSHIDRTNGDGRDGGNLTGLAQCFANIGAPEAACEAADSALNLIQSSLDKRELNLVNDALDRWANLDCVRRFRSRLNLQKD